MTFWVMRSCPLSRWERSYIQSVENAALLRVARERKTIVRMERGIGEFVVQHTALASLALEAPPDQETIAALPRLMQILEGAVRALVDRQHGARGGWHGNCSPGSPEC